MIGKRRFTAVLIGVSLMIGSFSLQGCGGKSDLSKLHDSLNKTAKALNAAAKTNRTFYEGGIYGTVGSDAAIAMRQKGATAVHTANERLVQALEMAKALTPATFEEGKIAILQVLTQAAGQLKTGNESMDLVLRSVAALITSAVAIIQTFNSADLRFVVPQIQSWTFPRLATV